jgi:hypothetical protein
MSLDADLDRLYQLPPSEFTAERNALAKRAVPRAAEIRALPRPTLAVWAVNQLHWRQPDVYRALIQSAENLRATHKAVLGGRRGDLRAAGRAHEEALDAALKATLQIAAEDGTPPSDAVRQAIGTTLRALPAGDPPGRLRQALAPGGFEMLTGLPSGGRVVPTPRPTQKKASGTPAGSGVAKKQADPAETARVRQALANAAQALSRAEQAARREEFEAARAVREADNALRRVKRAEEALSAAQSELQDAEEEAAEATKKRDAARARAQAADEALATARARHDAAQKDAGR